MAMRGPRHPVGSAAWVAEEKASAAQVARSEAEEFTYSVRNEFEWLNEHMNGLFNENEQNMIDVFKTPGKLRGKTPRTARKLPPGETRAPLSDVFSATPKGAPNPFATTNLSHARTPKLKVAEDRRLPQPPSPTRAVAPVAPVAPVSSPRPISKQPPPSFADSGYHGSQTLDAMDIDEQDVAMGHPEAFSSDIGTLQTDPVEPPQSPEPVEPPSPTQPTGEASFHSAKEEQTKTAKITLQSDATDELQHSEPWARSPSPVGRTSSVSPLKTSPLKTSPLKTSSPQRQSPQKATSPGGAPMSIPRKPVPSAAAALNTAATSQPDVAQSPSDGSSPIRPIVRKSSLNFASLPAREPHASTKSIGARMSRTSHLEQSRQSYYNRATGGKSLGNVRPDDLDDDNDDNDEMDIDDEQTTDVDAGIAAHNKTYTQRLQDQISMLGKSHSGGSRPSKSIVNLSSVPQTATAQTSHSQPTQPFSSSSQAPSHAQHQPLTKANLDKPLPSPMKDQSMATPGAFPEDEDEEDDWIAPPPTATQKGPLSSPSRPALTKSHTADVMEDVAGMETVSGSDFVLPKQRPASSREASPKRAPFIPERSQGGHAKSASVPYLPSAGPGSGDSGATSPKKTTVSVSNPALATVHETDRPSTPKSPSRSFRDSPLKQVKNKLSSILKSSKGLLASSAAISAEGKSSLLSPSTTRLGLHIGPSMESLAHKSVLGHEQALYPDLSQHIPVDLQSAASRPASPVRPAARKTRASTEREKREQKQKDKEAKEAQRQADQMGKLERARELEREKARVFSKEQERVAAMEKQLEAQREQERAAAVEKQLEAQREQERVAAMERQLEAQREQERIAAMERQLEAQKEQQRAAALQRQMEAKKLPATLEQEARARPPSPVKETPRATRSSPRKVKGQPEGELDDRLADDDLDMPDAPAMMPPPSVPRSAQPPKTQLRRPVKPTKEAQSKSKQAPTVIRVNTTSQTSQLHPSNSVLAATLQDTLGPQQAPMKPKASVASLHTKQSLQSLKSSVSSTGRPKALELAAKRREQEEMEAERKRKAKLELERKREQQRRAEAERQKEEERKQALQAEAKKNAQRQAAIEKAKQTRAPPPAQRSQQGRPEHAIAAGSIPRPPSRLDSTMASAAKSTSKRPLPQDDELSRPGPSRAGHSSYQTKEAKRFRVSDEFDVDELEMGGVIQGQANIKAPPVRPSGGFKKDLPNNKSYINGYIGAAGSSQSATRDLFKATVTSQHHGQVKAAHPLDMAQVSKGAIPFANNPNASGPSSTAAASATVHKTPARPVGGAAAAALHAKSAKSATRSSPRLQNQQNNANAAAAGDAIDLPEIDTDADDSDEDDQGGQAAPWADSPDLRKALMRQESVDPSKIFGPTGPLNMEEVFCKTKERWHKFRARTSSANWSGADRLTEEDIRKDLRAREKIRREGGWSYELSRDMA